MTTIKDILVLDLSEDIKDVIDLEDRDENEIQQELESYIVTDGIGRHINKFTDLFTSNIKETDVGSPDFTAQVSLTLVKCWVISLPTR
jgi:hypothetical protein